MVHLVRRPPTAQGTAEANNKLKLIWQRGLHGAAAGVGADGGAADGNAAGAGADGGADVGAADGDAAGAGADGGAAGGAATGEVGWTQKEVMAWAWPTIPLVDEALQHYQSGVLAQHQRDTARLLEGLLYGLEDGTKLFSSYTSVPSRFAALTGPLAEATKTLSIVMREGVLQKDANGVPEQRPGLAELFEPIAATRGKDGTDDGAEFQEGDEYEVVLFDTPDDPEVRFPCPILLHQRHPCCSHSSCH